MKCNEVDVLLSAYIDEEVTDEERQVVEEHLNACQVCQTSVAAFSRLHTWYHEMEVKQAPPDFRQRVTHRLEGASRWAWVWSWWRFPRLAYALSFLVVILLCATFVPRAAREPRQPSWNQMTLEIDVYAEDILFDAGATVRLNEVFSGGTTSIAEELLSTIDFRENGAWHPFGTEAQSFTASLVITSTWRVWIMVKYAEGAGDVIMIGPKGVWL